MYQTVINGCSRFNRSFKAHVYHLRDRLKDLLSLGTTLSISNAGIALLIAKIQHVYNIVKYKVLNQSKNKNSRGRIYPWPKFPTVVLFYEARRDIF
jgi:hypothetical protein